MSHIKLIRTKEDHEQALVRLMVLMDIDFSEKSVESDEIDVLALLIEKYEQDTFQIDLPDPIEAIKFRMEQQGLIKKDLIPFIGSAPKVTEILNGTRSLSINMIRKLSIGLGISADVLIQEKVNKSVVQCDVDWNAFPLSEMRKRSYFKGFSGSLRELKEYSAEQVGRFLATVPSGMSLKPAMLRSSAHLRSNSKKIDSYALWAWQVRVLQKAQEEKLQNQYVKGTVDLSWMSKLAQISWSEQGPKLAKEYLNKNGIHLIIEPHLAKTYLDGAVCLSETGNPVIALTLRHDKLDNFWFSLMHELAHIALHVDGTEVWFIDDLEVEGADQVEREADALAQESLIPEEVWNTSTISDGNDVIFLAKKLSISPSIIAGRIRHEMKSHTAFGKHFRDKVRCFF